MYKKIPLSFWFITVTLKCTGLSEYLKVSWFKNLACITFSINYIVEKWKTKKTVQEKLKETKPSLKKETKYIENDMVRRSTYSRRA